VDLCLAAVSMPQTEYFCHGVIGTVPIVRGKRSANQNSFFLHGRVRFGTKVSASINLGVL
jgi:hypothetical protein